MYIVVIEGMHGGGKTTAFRDFTDVVKFPENVESLLADPGILGIQNVAAQAQWAAAWVNTAARIAKDKGKEVSCILADRGPLSAVAYARVATDKERETLLAMHDMLIETLARARVYVRYVYLDVDRALLDSRIAERLAREKWREPFCENDDVRNFVIRSAYEWALRESRTCRTAHKIVVRSNKESANVPREIGEIMDFYVSSFFTQ